VKLGLRLQTYRLAEFQVPMDQIRLAERLGFDSVWTGETYGVDAITPLVHVGSHTSRLRLGMGVCQVAARPPTTLGMQALSLDSLAGGGRVIVGIGLSGPQIVEGWYGQPWGRPAQRLRDYLVILRKVLDREPVAHDGTEIAIPFKGQGATGEGKVLRTIIHPPARLPIWVGCSGTHNVEMTAELADGFLPNGLGASGVEEFRPYLDRGFAKRPHQSANSAFETFYDVSVIITDDVGGALEVRRREAAFLVGAMGSRNHNFHRDAMARRGYPEEAVRVQQLWLAGLQDEAIAAVPDDFVELDTLVGSPRRIRNSWSERIERLGVTGVIVSVQTPEELRLIADITS
jgi:F420-dependent oxidoreductase-like protein